MKKYFIILLSLFCTQAFGQANVLPAKEQSKLVVIKNATIHVGNGQVINNGVIIVNKGKIEKIGTNLDIPAGSAEVIDATGKHVYPGIILPTSKTGLLETGSIRASNDVREIGDLNPNVRSIVAYNSDSKVINTLRSNGILFANVVPQGSLLAGTSSVVQLDAWSYQEAAYLTDGGMHLYFPSLMARPSFRGGGGRGGPNAGGPAPDPVKDGLETLEKVKTFFSEAKAYLANPAKTETNLKFEATKNLFAKKQKLYAHADTERQILAAIDFVKEFGFDLVIVGGSESYKVTDLLKKYNVAVILAQAHRLPTMKDDDVDQPYKTAAALHKAGVLYTLTDEDDHNRGRNVIFNAGTTAAYGLNKEEALQAITLNAAKVLGIADKTGSLEVGKDANIVISSGDLLDMRTSNVTEAFIQGRKIDLDNKQKQLNDRYVEKYELKKAF